MTEHKELCEALCSASVLNGPIAERSNITFKAADLIEQQDARIAELEAKPKAKRLVWDESDPVYRVAQSACGEWPVYKTVDDTWRAQRRVILSVYIPIDGPHTTESEARAACQAEFDRIYAEMTEAPMVTT